MTTLDLWLRLDRKIYRRVNDVILTSSNGTTQIDHVLVSIYGLFVIETKTWTDGFSDLQIKRHGHSNFLARNLSFRIRCGRITDIQNV